MGVFETGYVYHICSKAIGSICRELLLIWEKSKGCALCWVEVGGKKEPCISQNNAGQAASVTECVIRLLLRLDPHLALRPSHHLVHHWLRHLVHR
jgi:hypothetical protein